MRSNLLFDTASVLLGGWGSLLANQSSQTWETMFASQEVAVLQRPPYVAARYHDTSWGRRSQLACSCPWLKWHHKLHPKFRISYVCSDIRAQEIVVRGEPLPGLPVGQDHSAQSVPSRVTKLHQDIWLVQNHEGGFWTPRYIFMISSNSVIRTKMVNKTPVQGSLFA